ncbi:hypothetical protein GCM10022631_08770 [Deinococcus rubellus]
MRPGHPARGLKSAGPIIIEGAFTYDALEDLFLYLCSRRETLTWQLTTLAGSFTLLLDQGQPADIMFRPVRPIGAYVGLRALQTLFQQQGGQFTVQRSPAALGSAALKRRSLNASGENLLIAMAALDDEHNASAVLSGIVVDDSAEAALVADLLPEDHRTAFVTRSRDTPLVDVLQLFSVSRRAYRVSLFGAGAGPVGQIDLSANQVGRVSAAGVGSDQQGQAALNCLLSLSLAAELRTEVSPLAADEWPGNPLGKLDSLLLRAALDGALATEPPSADTAPTVPAQVSPVQTSLVQASPVRIDPFQVKPVQSDLTRPPPGIAARLPDQATPPSPLQRLGRLLRRR